MTAVAKPLERARAAMGDARIDAVIVASPGMVAFLGGHVVPAQLAHPSRDGRLERPTVCVATADGEVATVGSRPEPAIGAAVPYGEGGRGPNDRPQAFSALSEALRGLGLTRGRVAVELSFVPAAALAAIESVAPALALEPLDQLLRAARATKSEDELRGIEATLALCDAGQDAVRAAAESGRSELDLYSVAVEAMNSASDQQVLALGEIQVGARGERMAGFPTAARVADGELVMCDLAPRSADGFWGDSCMTVACGDPPEGVREDWRRLRNGIEAAREVLRPGVTAGEVYAAVARFVPDLPGHAGHGIGRDHYEEPILLPGNPEALEREAVIVVEPGVYGDRRGLRIEHAFRVSDDGGVPLSQFSLEL